MVVIELTYVKPLDMVDKHLVAHCDFLDTYYKNNTFIASGPKIPREGGIILATCTKQEAEDLIKNDPFHAHGIAQYNITQFDPKRCNEKFKAALS